MRIAVVGATGNIGAPLTRKLLEAGYEVRAMSRGGAKLDELVKLGPNPLSAASTKARKIYAIFFAMPKLPSP